MQIDGPATHRNLKTESIACDLCVIGGGMAGVCAAITAARQGVKVTLIQDRPVLGGNASSEVRLWILGATAHMSNNNRWSREGGVIDELMVENVYRNPEGNPLIVDTILLEWVTAEPNIRLLLNTAVDAVEKKPQRDAIAAVSAFCAQNSTRYHVAAPLFCDASGDGIAAFLAGAAFRMGAETTEEFGERFAPDEAYGHLLGHSIYFYSKDVGQPVRFIPPAFAHRDIAERTTRIKQIGTKTMGCWLWWLEYGGRRDTIHETEDIKWELWRVVYGVWDHIKNSGEHPEAENLTLEWVGHVPGKRESRRFEGDHILTQQDIVEQREHDDAVSFGGWSIDLHPADGVYAPGKGCDQWHACGVYGIPYRCMFSRNIDNLFLAGRIISASHVAFGSSRVMATCAHNAQAVGMAAAICREQSRLPRDVNMRALQQRLLAAGQYIPGRADHDPADLAQHADIEAATTLRIDTLTCDGEPPMTLERSTAQLLPLAPGRVPRVTFTVDVDQPTTLRIDLRVSDKPGNYTPARTLGSREVALEAGADQPVCFDFDAAVDAHQYGFFCLMANPHVRVHRSVQYVTGLLTVTHSRDQQPPDNIGMDAFEVWTPTRRPDGRNLAVTIDPPLDAFDPAHVINGIQRPTDRTNAYVAAFDDGAPALTLHWAEPQTVARVVIAFDTDHDHAMESVLLGHAERCMPFCVKRFSLHDADGRTLHAVDDNHQTRRDIRLSSPTVTRSLTLRLDETWGDAPPAVFDVRCYGP